ncbi:hypothetical protein CHS0354_005261 [Potamilus streckersoni]|uniref:G-protein coupled receptors family 1 profile domain-containing protein n=1 Tax=Potamilus streckersoni TaxID=2493646 RepID=A0AAE0VPP0_9BIVA|nr:hypothetical protein CHS0354_005261 [Potamilus streckersoni]
MADYYSYLHEDYYNYLYNTISSMNKSTNFRAFNISYDLLRNSHGHSHFYYHPIFPFEVPILGYLLPALIFLMTLMNFFVVGIFLRNCNKKTTTILFLSIAISDTMTGISAVPGFIFVYGLKRDQLTMHMCKLILMLRLYVFPVFHTVSIWQTMALGFQRYMCVCHPFSSRAWCTIKKTIIAIAVFYIMSLCVHSFHLVEEKTHKGTLFSLCSWVIEKPCTGSCAYLWITLLLIHIFPCSILAILTAMTIYTMRKSAMKMENINCNKESGKRRWSRDRQINIMVVSIAIAFLIPELSNGIFYLVFIINEYISGEIFAHETSRLASAIYMVLLVLSFNFNFWVYCCMMKDFRRTVLRFFTLFYVKRGFERLRNLSSRSSMRSSRSSTSNSTNYRLTIQLSVKSDDVFVPNDESSVSNSNHAQAEITL